MLKRYRRELALLLGAAAIVLVAAADVLAQPRRPRRPVQPAYGWVSGTIRLDTSGAGVPGPRGGTIIIRASQQGSGGIVLSRVTVPVRFGETSWRYQGLRVPIRTPVAVWGSYSGDWVGGTGGVLYLADYPGRPVYIGGIGQVAVRDMKLRGYR